MARSKFIDFRFGIPVSTFTKADGTFISAIVGELTVQGRARIDGEKVGDLPAAFADGNDWVEIAIEVVQYGNSNILPMLKGLPSGKPMLDMVINQARMHIRTIYDQENF